MKILNYNQPPKSVFNQEDYSSWEKYSLPLGNGYFGACLFARADKERIQLTENSVANPYHSHHERLCCGLQSFGDIFIEFGHENISNYQRYLSLNDALFLCSYKSKNVIYTREAFASHPDNVLVYRISSNIKNSISFKICFDSHCDGIMKHDDGIVFERKTDVEYIDNHIRIKGKLFYYNVEYAADIKVVISGGSISSTKENLEIRNADTAVIYFSCKTNYVLSKKVFLENDNTKKTKHNPNLFNDVFNHIESMSAYTYDELYSRHLKDYHFLFNRVEFDLGECDSDKDTSLLLEDYRKGNKSLYLETLLFQFGRYLLISSSRKGSLPANLQGVWNAYKSSPWSSGYWHNINLQMNYWGCWSANLSDMFESYIDYALAYFPKCHFLADEYIKKLYTDRYEEGKNGWIIGTGAWPYSVEGLSTESHSGPGTGAFTSLLFWEHYAYTKDINYLKTVAYPFLYEMSIFLEKCLIYEDGKYLIKYSASPENVEDINIWYSYHRTKGCAFDQQMVYENFKQTIKASEILGVDNDPFIIKIKNILPNLDNVLIGTSGQIKEYREETYYSEIGDPHHRHISQLVGLYPGTQITELHPDWIKASEFTLNARGDESTGWSTMHRLLAWARIKNGSRADDLLVAFIRNNVMDNLWDKHPPFQIDGNFGYVAGISEMLVQSQEGFIDILPCLSPRWNNGSFKGIKARGNFEISCVFKNRKLVNATIKSLSGSDLVIKNKGYCIYKNDEKLDTKELYVSIKTKINEIIEITNE